MKSFTDYEKSEVKKELEKKLDYHKSFFEAFGKITRNYKKDGKPFENLAKNFNGCTVQNESYALAPGKELVICIQTQKNGYQSETIKNKETVRYSNITPDASRIIKEPMLEPYFYLTVDELETRINEQKAYHARRVDELEKAIKENDRDNATAEQLLASIYKTLESVNPDAASIYKEKLLRKIY